jgi:hypothetical protein
VITLDSVSRYFAVREWVPGVRLLILKTAEPLFKETVLSKVVPSYKPTDPVIGSGLIVALKTTLILKQEEFLSWVRLICA